MLTVSGNSVSTRSGFLFCLRLVYQRRHQTGVTETFPNVLYSTFTAEAPPTINYSPAWEKIPQCIVHPEGRLVPSRGPWNESSSHMRTVLINYGGRSLRLLLLSVTVIKKGEKDLSNFFRIESGFSTRGFRKRTLVCVQEFMWDGEAVYGLLMIFWSFLTNFVT